MNNKLYVGYLPFSTQEQELQDLFSGEGRNVSSVKILSDKFTGRSRGFGFVEMGNSEDAKKAIEALNGKEFQGRPLTVNEAKETQPRTGGPGGERRPGPRRDSRGDHGGHGSGGGRGGFGGGRGNGGGRRDWG